MAVMKKLVFAYAVVWALAGCSTSAGIGIGIPVGPLSVGLGVGSGGISAGVGTGFGPVGVGVGVNQRGQVSGGAGVSASVPVGGARIGAGIGSSTMLYDPHEQTLPPASPASPEPSAAAHTSPRSSAETLQWRDARGQIVPACRVQGHC